MIGVSGAAITGIVGRIQDAVVTLPAIHPKLPANSIYHHVPSTFFPSTGAVPPAGMIPRTLYTVPGPLRTFASVLVVMLGVHAATAAVVAVGLAASWAAGVKVEVASPVETWFGPLLGRLHATAARQRMSIAEIILRLLFIYISSNCR